MWELKGMQHLRGLNSCVDHQEIVVLLYSNSVPLLRKLMEYHEATEQRGL